MNSFTITRTFDAPRDLVFNCWVKPDRFERWFPPAECDSKLIHADVSPGGYYQQEDRWPDGTHCYIVHRFQSVIPPDRLVFVTSFCTEEGEIAKHPFAPSWPARMLTTVMFEDDSAGTKVTVVWEPVEASDEEIAFFTKILPGCHEGWTSTFDRLEETVKELAAPRN